eukprot:scaffold392341_cov32-Prasinocladus_malaysianus.AAC.1
MPEYLTYTVRGTQAPIDADIDDDGAFNWSLKIPQAAKESKVTGSVRQLVNLAVGKMMDKIMEFMDRVITASPPPHQK